MCDLLMSLMLGVIQISMNQFLKIIFSVSLLLWAGISVQALGEMTDWEIKVPHFWWIIFIICIHFFVNSLLFWYRKYWWLLVYLCIFFVGFLWFYNDAWNIITQRIEATWPEHHASLHNIFSLIRWNIFCILLQIIAVAVLILGNKKKITKI